MVCGVGVCGHVCVVLRSCVVLQVARYPWEEGRQTKKAISLVLCGVSLKISGVDPMSCSGTASRRAQGCGLLIDSMFMCDGTDC